MTRTFFKIILVCFTILTLTGFFSTAHGADEPEVLEKVVSKGMGTTEDGAYKNAISNAVEQTIGLYIKSESMVSNAQLIKDEILSYSGGYVKDIKIIRQEKDTDGLFSVTIQANVVSTKLKLKLEAINIAVQKVDGGSLFGEAISKISEKKNAAEIFEKTVSKYPSAAYVYNIGKPEVKSTNQSTGTVTMIIPISISWDESFLAEFEQMLSKIAKKELKPSKVGPFKRPNGDMRICFSKKALLASDRAEACYEIASYEEYIKEDTYVSFMNALSPRGGGRRDDRDYNMSFSLLFKDSSGKAVFSVEGVRERRSNNMSYRNGLLQSDSIEKQGLSNSVFKDSDRGFQPPNIIFMEGREGVDGRTVGGGLSPVLAIITDGVFNLNLEVERDANLFKNISTMEFKMNPLE